MSAREFVPLPGMGWVPANETTDLVGDPIAKDRQWFTAPPAEVGQVVAAWSTQRAGSTIWPTWLKFIILIIGALVAVGLAISLGNFFGQTPKKRADMVILFVCVFVPIAVLILAVALTWKHRIYFVGDQGVARFAYAGNVRNIKGDVLSFTEAMALRSRETRHYHNGVYTGTTFNYTWFRFDARRLLQLKGNFYRRKSTEKTNSAYRFAQGAQVLWNEHYFRRAVAELEQTGGVTFPVGKKDYIRILPGALELNFRGEQMHVTPAEIAKISLANGRFTIHHKDAGWLSRKGKFSFGYGDMSNGQVFLLLMERLVGYRFT